MCQNSCYRRIWGEIIGVLKYVMTRIGEDWEL